MPNRALIISAATRIPTIDFFIDGFPQTTHTMELEKADEPLEDGTAVTDHATALPEGVKLVGWVTGMNGADRPAAAWERLRQLNADREPVTVITEWGTYDEMLPTRIEASQDARGLRFDMTLKRVIRVGDTAGDLPSGTTGGPASQRPGSVDRGRVALPTN